MKKKILITILILVICIVFASCEAPYEAELEYRLSGLFLGETELDVKAIYPEGGEFSIGAEGNGKLRLGQQECDIMYSEDGDNITVMINGMPAVGSFNENEVSFSLEGTDLIYVFSSQTGTAGVDQMEKQEKTDLQKQWNGTWEGFVVFTEQSGKWDYLESSLMHVTGSVAIDSEGNGAILLYSPAFSDTVPAIALNIIVTEYKAHETSGYFFDFVCEEGDADIAMQKKDKGELFSTEFIHPEEYSWYVPDQNILPLDDEPEITDVISISGKCIDGEGGFRYDLDLSRTDGIN